MQKIKIYQAANNKSKLETPIKSPDRKPSDPNYPWLLPGYYFWEYYIQDAEEWGRVRYKNDYSVYSCEYELNDEHCLDLVSNYKHKEFLIRIKEKLESKGEKNVTVEKLVKYLTDNRSDIICTRIESSPMSQRERECIPTPNNHYITFNPKSVQVCFYQFPNELITEDFKLEKTVNRPPILG